ncbi:MULTISPECIES: DUF2062 domain-containing protein [unclassified Roseitalea]|uniref:DUF2062 domain-containing protein n=1 Tax=unclassified Roseitalea TaxID=2639107 RepID=UPI00273DF255|nr:MULTISPECIES: DUF2062 domain-containing protein [unclassified Roseitalea]
MLFKRRNREDAWTRLRVWLLPRRNYARSMRYYGKRVLRIRATPHAIAAGVAAGAFASFTPLMGFHFILSFLVAFLVRGSMIAAALGTAIGNPLTFPMIWAGALGTGRWILGIEGQADGARFGEVWAQSGFAALWDPWIKPMLVGGIPLGLAAGAVAYAVTRAAVIGFQTRRAARKAEKAIVKAQQGKAQQGTAQQGTAPMAAAANAQENS